MNLIQVVNKHYYIPSSNDIFIGRPSVLGNPYSHLANAAAGTIKVHTRDRAVSLYRDYLIHSCIHNQAVIDEITLLAQRQEQFNLVCYCKPAACHGDVITDLLVSLRVIKDVQQIMQGTTAEKHTTKECRKIGFSNKAIIHATEGSAQRLAQVWDKVKRLNLPHYQETDIVMLSANGKRKNAFLPVINGQLQGHYTLIDDAIKARACFVADTSVHLASNSYNIGEQLLAEYLHNKGYTRMDYLGVGYWLPPADTKWARKCDHGYECSSKGDKRLSAFYAAVNGKSIEEAYQVSIKGYPTIAAGKGQPPLNPNISREQLWECYLGLWRIYFQRNPLLYIELRKGHYQDVFTDMFASSDINQARAISELVNKGL